MTLDDTLAVLHATQRAAVTHPARPLLLACGPGNGKTRILTHRIQWLIQNEGLEAAEILALTFSRAAADVLRGRLARALGPLARGLWAGTFHGFGAWLLRRHTAPLERTAAFTILDREDTRRVIARLVEDLGLEGDLVTWVEAVERAKAQPRPAAGDSPATRSGPLATLLAAYETRCQAANGFDFVDLLTAPLALVHRDPARRTGLRCRFRAVLVDEAQDLCALQHALVEALAAPDGAVTFAGDDDQAIYGWRGGDVTRLHAFERTYVGGTLLAVGRNYRSTPQIVATAARLIGHNPARRPKPLAAVRPGGPVPQVLTWADDRAEAEGLAARCPDWLRTSAPPIAILARVTACLGPLARACAAQGLGVRVLAERPLVERAAVRDLLALWRVLVNPLDWPAWERVLRVGRSGVGARTLATLRTRVRAVGVAAALREAAHRRRGLAVWLDRLQAWRATLPPVTTRLEIVAAEIPGHPPDAPAESPDEERDRRAEDVATLLALARRWEQETGGRLPEFLDTVVLTEEETPGSAATDVLGLTLHAAKGLEFDTVVIVGAEKGLLPHYRHTVAETLAEERRLCYVGMTRAREHLIFSVARMRRLWGDVAFRPPSRFLREAGLTGAPGKPRESVAPAGVAPS
jgi:DNA helicase-2/ATP-dependent DNA helicase PcrA